MGWICSHGIPFIGFVMNYDLTGLGYVLPKEI